MTGGQCYLWDPRGELPERLNPSLVEAIRPAADHLRQLRWLIEQHLELTGSPRAQQLLADWATTGCDFWHVVPLGRVRRLEAQNAGRVSANV
jgi:glutamate synthase domain-containing protein 3